MGFQKFFFFKAFFTPLYWNKGQEAAYLIVTDYINTRLDHEYFPYMQ